MDFVKIIHKGNFYNYDDASSMEICILGLFLTDDVGKHPSSFREWVFDNNVSHASINATRLSKENGCILLSDLYSEENKPTQLKITYSQFLQILTDWEEKVLKLQPKEVIIKYENDQFIFETKN